MMHPYSPSPRRGWQCRESASRKTSWLVRKCSIWRLSETGQRRFGARNATGRTTIAVPPTQLIDRIAWPSFAVAWAIAAS
jgi:hypothetical protein